MNIKKTALLILGVFMVISFIGCATPKCSKPGIARYADGICFQLKDEPEFGDKLFLWLKGYSWEEASLDKTSYGECVCPPQILPQTQTCPAH